MIVRSMLTQPRSPLHLPRLRRLVGTRAATVAEYALLLVGVILIGAGALKLLGKGLSRSADSAASRLDGPGGGSDGEGGGTAGGGYGGGYGRGGGGGTGGGGGVGGGGNIAARAEVGSKAEVGGGGGGRVAAGDSGGSGRSGGTIEGDLFDDLRLRRAFGLGLLAFGVLSVAYVAFKARNVKKKVDAEGGGDDPPPSQGFV
jgi:hypothetical protein